MVKSSGENATGSQRLPPSEVGSSAAVHGLHRIVMANQEDQMPRGDKSAYTEKQKRQAEHIEEGYEKRGTSKQEAERRAWATVNKATGGGKKSGSGRGKGEDHTPFRKGCETGGRAAAARPKSAR